MTNGRTSLAAGVDTAIGTFESTFRALDREFRVVADHPDVPAILDSLLQPFLTAGPTLGAETYAIADRSDGPGHAIYLDGDRILNTLRLDGAAKHVVWHALKRAAEETDRFLVLHGAAVESNGIGVILAAPPDSGKTTLAAALVGMGFRFLADEYVLIDRETGRVHPYARPFLLPVRSTAPLEQLLALPTGAIPRDASGETFVPPGRIRPGPLGEPCPVRYIIRPGYLPGASTGLEPNSRANVILELARESFNFDRLGPSALPLLAGVVEGSATYDLPMSDLRQAMLLVTRLVIGGSA
jgi:hypothetical protein